MSVECFLDLLKFNLFCFLMGGPGSTSLSFADIVTFADQALTKLQPMCENENVWVDRHAFFLVQQANFP